LQAAAIVSGPIDSASLSRQIDRTILTSEIAIEMIALIFRAVLFRNAQLAEIGTDLVECGVDRARRFQFPELA
jgi:hypothetical protein